MACSAQARCPWCSGNRSAAEGTGVSLHGTGNNTSGDAIVSYAWDLDNNGTFETAGQNVNFNPDLPGNYPVALRVTDDDGQTATDSAAITINDVAPTANAGGSQSANEGTGLTLHGSVQDRLARLGPRQHSPCHRGPTFRDASNRVVDDVLALHPDVAPQRRPDSVARCWIGHDAHDFEQRILWQGQVRRPLNRSISVF